MAKEKVAVITGASHGIGASLVSAYSEAEYYVVANSRSIGASTNPSIVNIAGDIGEPDTADRIMNEGVQRFGRLDTLVNNACVFILLDTGHFALETNVDDFASAILEMTVNA